MFSTRVSCFIPADPPVLPAAAGATVVAVRPLTGVPTEDEDATNDGGRDRLEPTSKECMDRKDRTFYSERNVSIRIATIGTAPEFYR